MRFPRIKSIESFNHRKIVPVFVRFEASLETPTYLHQFLEMPSSQHEIQPSPPHEIQSSPQHEIPPSIELPSLHGCTDFSTSFDSHRSQILLKYKHHPRSPSSGIEGPDPPPSNGAAKTWKAEVGRQLELDMEYAILLRDAEMETQLHREIGVYQSFINMEYFEALEANPETTADTIRIEIRQGVKDVQRCMAHPKEGFTSSVPPSSPLSFRPPGSSPPRVIKPLPKKQRLSLAVEAVFEEDISIRNAAHKYNVNRRTLSRRVKGPEDNQHGVHRLLTDVEEAAILRFVDRYAELGFPPTLEMVTEKAILLLRARGVEREPGLNWSARFLNRHPAYKTRFPRHLDQARYWNSDPQVLSDWFKLYEKVCLRYGIANGDQYNMDEKGFMEGVSGNVR